MFYLELQKSQKIPYFCTNHFDMVAIEEKIYTVEEYLELEKTSEIRHEFVYGKRIPMSGESKNANEIAGHLEDME